MATCDTPGTVTITPKYRLCRKKSMAVARGLAIVKPEKTFLVKLCNFGEDQVIVGDTMAWCKRSVALARRPWGWSSSISLAFSGGRQLADSPVCGGVNLCRQIVR